MCQLKVIREQDGGQEVLMESVTTVEVSPTGVLLGTYFEEPLRVEGVWIQRLDLLTGVLVLVNQPISTKKL
jgi:predicted RNA-binding protein